MRLLRIFLGILVIFLLAGCLDTLLDDISPSIFFDNVSSVNGEYIKVYSGQNVSIKGRVEDNDEIDYLKNDGEKVEIKDGSFEVIIPNTQEETVFEVADKAGNKTKVTIKLALDDTLPVFSEILINDESYSENMVIGNLTSLDLAVKVVDENGIDRVQIGDDTLTSGEGEYFRYTYTGTLLSGTNSIDIDVWDNAGNWSGKTISFYYDREIPVLQSLKMDDEALEFGGTTFYTGKASFKLEMNFTDNSDSINVTSMTLNGNDIVGAVSAKKITIDPLTLTTDSTLSMAVEDEFGNRLSKVIYIRYRSEEPAIEDVAVELSDGSDLNNENGIYYTSSSTIVLNGTVDAENGDGLYLKSFTINGDAYTVNSSGEFTKTVVLTLDQGENTVEIEAVNNANTKTVTTYIIYYDTQAPTVDFNNLLKDSLNENSYISFRQSGVNEVTINGTVTDGSLSRFLIGDTEVTLDESNRFSEIRSLADISELIYFAEDNSGNITTGTIDALTDDQSPGYKAGTIKINGETYYENIIIEPISEETAVEIELEAIDNNGVNSVEIDGEEFIRKEEGSDIFIYSTDEINTGINLKDLQIEDYAGNINIATSLRYRYYNGDPDINAVEINDSAANETDTYYVSESSIKLEFNAVSGDSEMDLDTLRVTVNDVTAVSESGADGIKTIDNLYLDIKDGLNKVEIYLKNESGKEISRTYNVYYDATIPVVSQMKVAYTSFGKKLSETDYTQNMAYPYPESERQADTILISFDLVDDMGLNEDTLQLEFADGSKLSSFEKDESIYTFEIEREKLYEGLNRIKLVVLDNAGNILNRSIYINFYKLYAIEIQEPTDLDVETDSIKVTWHHIQFATEIVDRYELYMKRDGESEYSLEAEGNLNYAKITGLKDNEKYDFYVKVYDKYYISPNNTEDSIHKEIRTDNRKPQITVVKLESVNNDIEGIRDYSVKFSWNKASTQDEHDFMSYLIYRQIEDQETYEKIATVDSLNEVFYSDADEDLKENKLIKYKLSVLDRGGERSDFSNEISLYSYNLPPDIANSSFDFNFEDESTGTYGIRDENNKIKLTMCFNDIASEIPDLDHYEIYRSRDYDTDNSEEVKPNTKIYSGYISGGRLQSEYEDGFDLTASLDGTDIVLSESGLKENRKYYYSIRIYDSDRDLYDKEGSSVIIGDVDEYEETEIKELMTKDLSPPTLSKLEAIINSNTVSLSWDMDYIDDFASYEIYKLRQSADSPDLIITDINSRVYQDTDVNFGTTPYYQYLIKIKDTQGNETEIRFEVDENGNITEY